MRTRKEIRADLEKIWFELNRPYESFEFDRRDNLILKEAFLMGELQNAP